MDKCLPVKIFISSQIISQKPIELLVLHVPYFESIQNILWIKKKSVTGNAKFVVNKV